MCPPALLGFQEDPCQFPRAAWLEARTSESSWRSLQSDHFQGETEGWTFLSDLSEQSWELGGW